MTEIATAKRAATRRCERIKTLLRSMSDQREKVLTLITEAKESDDHTALGYPSWTAYVSTEYADLLGRLTREDRREAVLTLTETGMSTRAIAGVVGASKSQVADDIKVQVSDSGHVISGPSSVVGTDGKTYRQRTGPRPGPVEPEPEPTPSLTRAEKAAATKARKMAETETAVEMAQILGRQDGLIRALALSAPIQTAARDVDRIARLRADSPEQWERQHEGQRRDMDRVGELVALLRRLTGMGELSPVKEDQ